MFLLPFDLISVEHCNRHCLMMKVALAELRIKDVLLNNQYTLFVQLCITQCSNTQYRIQIHNEQHFMQK